ncbi:DUF2628 domain-containing protein [Metabacillus sp. GX 13764]|uniref:DUF2628 domain-containing protein n=1 Tax=Metabacillus kandeliae TaxID=2900151 RepID=UPI001E6575F4|nr:DUF2628 domain-containing protein [Metabacillus kandeliae]MCD7034054.1 DUF2628 domain-containing protein [Metabacillus kandeliae]
MYCSHCGEPLELDANFCSNCGAPVEKRAVNGHEENEPDAVHKSIHLEKEAVPEETEEPRSLTEEEELTLFTGPNAEVYHRKWESARNKAGWNWASFFLSGYWLLYRKMYALFFIFAGISVVLNIFTLPFRFMGDAVNLLTTIVVSILGIALMVIFGIYGNYFYYRHAKKKIADIKSLYHSRPELIQGEIAKAGGTSWIGVSILAAVQFILILLVAAGTFLYIFFSLSDSETTVAPSIWNDSSAYSGQTIGEAMDEYMTDNGISLTADDVQQNLKANLDQDFAIAGKAALSSYYGYGFAEEKADYFSVEVTPPDAEPGDTWHLYFDRQDFADFYHDLKNGTVGNIVAACNIPKDLYEPEQGNLAFAEDLTWSTKEAY